MRAYIKSRRDRLDELFDVDKIRLCSSVARSTNRGSLMVIDTDEITII